uniref:Putative ovule protein n=1 Tax=Solanum chacoense TaxID=4108 RepID=A0A0V0H336_SOLCH
MIETDSLGLQKIIQKQWKVPWEIVEKIENISDRLHQLNSQVKHKFREGNSVADVLANTVIEIQSTDEYHSFQELPINIRKLINMDKSQIPSLRIRSRKINAQQE